MGTGEAGLLGDLGLVSVTPDPSVPRYCSTYQHMCAWSQEQTRAASASACVGFSQYSVSCVHAHVCFVEFHSVLLLHLCAPELSLWQKWGFLNIDTHTPHYPRLFVKTFTFIYCVYVGACSIAHMGVKGQLAGVSILHSTDETQVARVRGQCS